MRFLAKALGGLVMTIAMVSLIVAILLVFKLEGGTDPALSNYVIATAYGAAFGVGISLGGYWMVTGRWRSRTQTLRVATVIMVVICASVLLWVYALITHGINELGHPVWASAMLAATVVGLIVWAVRHQLRWGRRAEVAADKHHLSTLSDLRTGEVFKLRGRVHVTGLLAGPVTKRPCALFNLDILEDLGSDYGPNPMVAAQLERSQSFVLRCGDGAVRVEPTQFIAGFVRSAQHFGPLSDEDPEILQALERRPKGPLSGRELSLGNNDIVDVVGRAKQGGGGWVLTADESSPVIVVQKDPKDPNLGPLPNVEGIASPPVIREPWA